MDGNSYRRRRSCIIDFEFNFDTKSFENFIMTPTFVNKDLLTVFAPIIQAKKAKKAGRIFQNSLKALPKIVISSNTSFFINLKYLSTT